MTTLISPSEPFSAPATPQSAPRPACRRAAADGRRCLRCSGHERRAVVIALGVSGAAAVLVVLATLGMARVSAWHSPRPTPVMHGRLAGAAAGPTLDTEACAKGKSLFAQSCVACHGPKGLGVEKLGKDLVHSDFVLDASDGALVAFLVKGREVTDGLNTTGMPMPARGGNPDLTDADLAHIAVYLRGLQDPRRIPALPAIDTDATTDVAADGGTAPTADGGGGDELAAAVARGRKLFVSSCSACHGPAGQGLPKLGKPLAKSEFIQKTDDDALMAFILKGRSAGDPANTTRVDMPPKGGNPALNEDQLWDIVDFIRSLNPESPS